MVPAAALSGRAAFSQEASGSQSAVEHRGFSLSAGTCELGADFCAISTPRAWTSDEIELVRGALDEIGSGLLGRQVLERARANGFKTLRRYVRAARLTDQGGYEAQPMTVATAHVDEPRAIRTIDVNDRFFDRRGARDHFSGTPGYLLTTEILAHELVHAVDVGQQYSGTADFRRIARLGMTAAQVAVADRVNAEREPLIAARQHEADWRASRSFAIVTLRGRLPSMRALEGYREAFAEFGAHLMLDPHASTQIEPRVIKYVDRAVSGAP
jgi:hypothetical protein